MRRLLCLFVLGLAAVAQGSGIGATYSSGSAGISVTQTNTATTFVDNRSGGSGSTFGATTVSVSSRSTSANSCAVNFNDTTAVAAADIRVAPGATVIRTTSITQPWPGIGMICAAGETATFDVIAQP